MRAEKFGIGQYIHNTRIGKKNFAAVQLSIEANDGTYNSNCILVQKGKAESFVAKLENK